MIGLVNNNLYSNLNHTQLDPSKYPHFKLKQLIVLITFSVLLFLISCGFCLVCVKNEVLSYKEPGLEKDIWTDMTNTSGKLEVSSESDDDVFSDIE
eukprot:gene2824-4231_t